MASTLDAGGIPWSESHARRVTRARFKLWDSHFHAAVEHAHSSRPPEVCSKRPWIDAAMPGFQARSARRPTRATPRRPAALVGEEFGGWGLWRSARTGPCAQVSRPGGRASSSHRCPRRPTAAMPRRCGMLERTTQPALGRRVGFQDADRLKDFCSRCEPATCVHPSVQIVSIRTDVL